MMKREERSKRRAWKFQGDREEERHQYVQRAMGKIRFCEFVLRGDALQHVERVKDF
jgi:hypothetical protein